MSGTTWDAVVVGAGPAGSATALGLRRAGLDVLLVDRQAFPRAKVCGACLSRGAVDLLGSLGLGGLPARLGAHPLTRIRLGGWRRRAELRLEGGYALSRSALDDALVKAAVAEGVRFRDRARARLLPAGEGARALALTAPDGVAELRARVVIVAGGLGGEMNDPPPSGSEVRRGRPRGRLGLGAVLPAGGADYASGTIHMAITELGYVGLVRVEDGSLNVAAALDADALGRGTPPGALVASLLGRAGFPVPAATEATDWVGTPRLTRRPSSLGGERLFRVGDAAGYVEPFTGEGMCWALAGAAALVPIASRAARAWDPGLVADWEATHAASIGRAQRLCRATAWTLRRPLLTRLALTALGAFPDLARPFVRAAASPPSPPLPTVNA